MENDNQIEWQKMIKEILAAKDLKYGCRLSDWEVARLEEWSGQNINFLTDKQGGVVEKIYQEKMP